MPVSTSIAVIGAGAFGRNHLRVYRELAQSGAPVRLAAVVDPDPVARTVADQYSIAAFTSINELLEARREGHVAVDAASLCAPTSAHFPLGMAALEGGLDLLIEKPIAATLAEADHLIAAAARHGRTLQVGHLERFNPAVLAAAERLRGPMFFEAHRLSVFTPRSLDVDVVLDLMIHDLDIVLSFAGSPVREVRAVGLPVLSHKVDIANARVEFASGCVANFTASRVSTERVRKLRFFQPRQYVSIDYARQDVLLIDVGGEERREAALPHPSAGLRAAKPPVTPGEPLRLEIEAFLAAVRERRQPRVPGEDGRAALALGLAITEAIEQHAKRAGLPFGERA